MRSCLPWPPCLTVPNYSNSLSRRQQKSSSQRQFRHRIVFFRFKAAAEWQRPPTSGLPLPQCFLVLRLPVSGKMLLDRGLEARSRSFLAPRLFSAPKHFFRKGQLPPSVLPARYSQNRLVQALRTQGIPAWADVNTFRCVIWERLPFGLRFGSPRAGWGRTKKAIPSFSDSRWAGGTSQAGSTAAARGGITLLQTAFTCSG